MILIVLLLLCVGSLNAAEDSMSVAHQLPASDDSPMQSTHLYQDKPGSDLEYAVARRHFISGEWKSIANRFSKRGVAVLFDYASDNLANLSGGHDKGGAYLHRVDCAVGIDAGFALGWYGANLLVHVMNTNGGSLAGYSGSAQYNSMLESSRATRLYQAWFQQRLLHNKLSVLVGLYDPSNEFYVTEVSRMFLNSSFAVGKDLSQTGGPTFPSSGLGVRVMFNPSPVWMVRIGAFDAVPDKLNNGFFPSVRITNDEGALLLAEASFFWFNERETSPSGKYAFGFWRYTTPADQINLTALSGQPHTTNANFGYYLIGEQRVASRADDPRRGLDLFARLGFANGHIHRYNFNLSGGLVYTGLLAGREEDKVGLAVTHANNSMDYQQAKRIARQPFSSGEMVLEFTYRAQLTPWLVLQPNVQHVVHPGTEPAIRNATVVGTRIDIGF